MNDCENFVVWKNIKIKFVIFKKFKKFSSAIIKLEEIDVEWSMKKKNCWKSVDYSKLQNVRRRWTFFLMFFKFLTIQRINQWLTY